MYHSSSAAARGASWDHHRALDSDRETDFPRRNGGSNWKSPPLGAHNHDEHRSSQDAGFRLGSNFPRSRNSNFASSQGNLFVNRFNTPLEQQRFFQQQRHSPDPANQNGGRSAETFQQSRKSFNREPNTALFQNFLPAAGVHQSRTNAALAFDPLYASGISSSRRTEGTEGSGTDSPLHASGLASEAPGAPAVAAADERRSGSVPPSSSKTSSSTDHTHSSTQQTGTEKTEKTSVHTASRLVGQPRRSDHLFAAHAPNHSPAFREGENWVRAALRGKFDRIILRGVRNIV